MKKIFLIIGLLISTNAFASTMCALNDTVAVVLDPSLTGSNDGRTSTTSTWWTQFSYGRISGIAACIDTDGNQTGSKLVDTNGNRIAGGEKNGKECWCKMTHPAASLWVHHANYASAASCVSGCMNTYDGCGYRYRHSDFAKMFSSITN